ncbi:MAG: hypothetical protein ACD_26C00034G0050 [uncultured bacterium]|nr:MAG: hypothetical protein ACD_26C00034G0050 [uncultured bacterium]
MKKNPKVSIIITNYNGGQVLLNCIESVKKINYPNFELILVDDMSVDDSFQKVLNNKGKLKIKSVINKRNLGFAGANNEGLRLAFGDYVLLLNNDTLVDRELLRILVDRMEKDSTIGVAQPKIKMMDRKGYLDNAGSFLTKTGFLSHWGFGEKDSDEFDNERIIFSAKGACLMIKREVVEKIGLFDKDFGSYMEESDFCWRAWTAGYKVYYLPETYIYHKLGYTFSRQVSPININYNSFKNRILMLYKNLETKNLFLILIPHLVILTVLSFYYLFKFQFAKFLMIVRAMIWNIKNIVTSSKKRKMIQKMRTINDDDLFKIILHKINIKKSYADFIRVENDMDLKKVK